MQQLLQLLAVVYGVFLFVVPFVIINLLITIRRDLGELGERQVAAAQTQDQLNRTLATLADSLRGYQRDTWAAERPEARASTVPGSPARGAADALATLLGDPEIAKGARDVRRIYGPEVCASFLSRKAAERGLPLPELTAADLPAVL